MGLVCSSPEQYLRGIYLTKYTRIWVKLVAPYRGTTQDTRGTAFVVYEDIFDAKNACDHLSGFNVSVLPTKQGE